MTLTQSMERAQKDSRDIQSPRGSNVTFPREGTYSVVPKKKYYRFLGTGHAPTDCHFKSAKCNEYHKTGHIAKACQTRESLQGKQAVPKSAQKQKAGMHNEEESPSPKPEIADIIHVHTSPHIPRSYKIMATINSIHGTRHRGWSYHSE